MKTKFVRKYSFPAMSNLLNHEAIEEAIANLAVATPKQIAAETRPNLLKLASQIATGRKLHRLRTHLADIVHQRNTVVTVHFKQESQDFSKWEINASGYVINSAPCQAWNWVGCRVLNTLFVGGEVAITDCYNCDTIIIKYPITKLEVPV